MASEEAASEADQEEPKPKCAMRTLQEKIGLCVECERVVKAEKKLSMCKFCDQVAEREGRPVQPSQMRRWLKKVSAVRVALDNAKKRATEVSINQGRKSRLEPIADSLLPHVDNLQAAGKTVLV